MSIVSEKSRSNEQPLSKTRGRLGIALAIAAAIATGVFAGTKIQQGTKQITTPTPVASTTPVASYVTALGRLEPRGEVIKLSAPSSGPQQPRVEQILVKEGQRVREGQVVAILDNHNTLKAALEKTKGQLQVARAKLVQAKVGVPDEIEAQKATVARIEAQLRGEIAAQQATINRIEAELQGQRDTLQATVARIEAERRNAQAEAKRYEDLYEEGAISIQERDRRRLSAETSTQQLNESQAQRTQTIATLQQQLIEAQANRDKTIATLQKQIEEAQANLSKTTQVLPTDVEVAQAEVQSAIAAVKQAQADFDLSYTRTPISGEILKIHTKPGETISSDGIAEIGKTDQMMIIAEVPEDSIAKVRLGQKAKITSDNGAFNGELQGTVTDVGRQIAKQDVLDTDPAADVDARVVEVKIGLPLEASQRVSGLTYAKVVVQIDI